MTLAELFAEYNCEALVGTPMFREIEARIAELEAENARLRKALKDIQACPDGKSKSWPEIDAIIRAALNPTGDAMISGVWQ